MALGRPGLGEKVHRDRAIIVTHEEQIAQPGNGRGPGVARVLLSVAVVEVKDSSFRTGTGTGSCTPVSQ
jgi:hypothetical protein